MVPSVHPGLGSPGGHHLVAVYDGLVARRLRRVVAKGENGGDRRYSSPKIALR